MKVRKKAILAGALLLTGLGTYTLGAVAANIGGPPGPPPWAKANGVVDLDKVPACLERVGPDGQIVKDSNGRPACVPREQVFAPPPPLEE